MSLIVSTVVEIVGAGNSLVSCCTAALPFKFKLSRRLNASSTDSGLG
jgi:hypothetical protein